MALFEGETRTRVDALVKLGYCNPFLPERIGFEREILGDAFSEAGSVWHKQAAEKAQRPNIERLTRFAEDMADDVRQRLIDLRRADDGDCALYENVVLYLLYNRYEIRFWKYIRSAGAKNDSSPALMPFYESFERDLYHYFDIPGLTFGSLPEREHLFACFYQLRRAFFLIFENIIGGSAASANLRAATWQSIFTCDMQRYRRALYRRMGDVTTLITGPSGTGKELVARAIAYAQYIPFDASRKRPLVDFRACFHPVNLSELSSALIESELFGHVKGSFTGAVNDHAGFFEVCHECGSVLLDELGELDPVIQVKLLRVFEDRTFRRIGETATRPFRGKIIAATNRDLAAAVQAGRFREDLYYRLCSDTICTPSLREQIADAPDQLRNLLLFIARRVAGEEEADALAEETERWIAQNLSADYPWPGNVRELEQCVRNVMVRSAYFPAPTTSAADQDAYIDAIRSHQLTADELLAEYCARVHCECGSYTAAADRLGLDRRTVKAYVEKSVELRN